MQGARPIYIYRLAPCTENCSQRIYKTFSIKYLEHVHIFSTFEPKKHKSVFQAAVSTCTLKILCCGYNLATQKGRRFIKNYDTRRYKEYSFSSLTSLQALKICYSNILSELHASAICVASEYISPTFRAEFYNPEYEETHSSTDKNPYMAFEKDFLRFMLSDGAGAVFLQDHPEGECPLKVEWIEMTSYANELPTCMFMGSELTSMEQTKSWKEFTPEEMKSRGVMLLKQDIRQLKKHIIKYWVDHIETVLAKHNIKAEEIDYVIPHVSSMFFYEKLNDEITARGIALTKEKWFTNLTSVGNIGSAAIYVALDELIRTKDLKRGGKILLLVPESGRFSYGTVLLSL